MSVDLQWSMPAHWEDFEDMCYRLAVAEGHLTSGRKYGRRGQQQHGVDIVGKVNDREWSNVGIQCKLKTDHLGGELRAAELVEIYEKSKSLPQPLEKLYVATTIARDTEISLLVDQINASWQRRHFLEVWTWDDICDFLNVHTSVAARYYSHLGGFSDDAQLTKRGDLEMFLCAGDTPKTSRRLRSLTSHDAFRNQFGAAAPEVANALSEYVLNCLHVRKGQARRVAISLDGTQMVIEDDGQAFDPLNRSFVAKPTQLGLRTIQALTTNQPRLLVDYTPKVVGGQQAFNRFVIMVPDRQSIVARHCSVHMDAAVLFSREDGHAFFNQLSIPDDCDPFTIHVGATDSSSSGTHEVVVKLNEYLVNRRLVVMVAPHRPDLYAALVPSLAHLPNVSLQLL